MPSLVIEPKTVTGRAYELLVQLITQGHLAFGDRLDERALASEMQISRTPLREAISMLAMEGVVEYRPYQGNFVRTFTERQIEDLYELRQTLEGLAVRTAVARLTDEGLAQMREIVAATDRASAAGDIASVTASDRRFHETIAALSQNQSLIEALDRLAVQIQLIRSVANRRPGVIDRTGHERRDILEAFERRDAARAQQVMEEHIEGVKRAVVTQFAGDDHESPPLG